MKTVPFESREQWMSARMGKVTGTRLKDLIVKRGTGKKIGFYELIAERLMVDESTFEGYVPNETPMDRGTRLQKYAIDRFKKATGKEVDEKLVLWIHDNNESIAISPDGVISETEAVETKCLSAANHIKALITNAIPDDYEYQVAQYFIVNEKLQTLYFVFYDPRIACKDFFYIKVERDTLELDVKDLFDVEVRELKEVDEWVAKLSGF